MLKICDSSRSECVVPRVSLMMVLAALTWATGCANIEDADSDGYSPDQGDCDDTDPQIRPDAVEIPADGVDGRCNGNSDEDLDNDGYSLDGTVGGKPDCSDENPSIFPGQAEFVDGLDQDCDSIVDNDTTVYDDDGDGLTELDGDCNDRNADVHVAAVEVANGIDDDCDSIVDEGSPGHDDDGDGLSEDEGDCDDSNPLIFPGASETGPVSGVIGDGVDNDCDGVVDEGTTSHDDDDDGFFETGLVPDCDDANPSIYPGAQENFADGLDSDCDGVVELSPTEGPLPAGVTDVAPSILVPSLNTVEPAKCNDPNMFADVLPFDRRIYVLHFYDVDSMPNFEQDEINAGIGTVVAAANVNFAQMGVEFVVGGVESVTNRPMNDDLNSFDELAQVLCDLTCTSCNPECAPINGRIPVLIHNHLVEPFFAGLAYNPVSGVRGVAMRREDLVRNGGDVFVHELGHYFGLAHTHHATDPDTPLVMGDSTPPELVNGSNCRIAGDNICDTPADPGPRDPNDPNDFGCLTIGCGANCTNILDADDAQYQPATLNFMAYYYSFSGACTSPLHFTPQQRQRMLCAMRFSPHLATLTEIGQPCAGQCCDGATPIVDPQFSGGGCDNAAQAACYAHGGLHTYTYLSDPPVSEVKTCAPNHDCYVRCSNNVLVPVGQYQSSDDCVEAGLTACQPLSEPIRIAYNGYYAWCAADQCWVKCNSGPTWTALNVGLSECQEESEAACQGEGGVDLNAYCPFFGDAPNSIGQ